MECISGGKCYKDKYCQCVACQRKDSKSALSACSVAWISVKNKLRKNRKQQNMNMISQLRQRVLQSGEAIITTEEFNQLQGEWIKRTTAEYMVKNLTVATKALEGIMNSPFDCEGYPSAKQAAGDMNLTAAEALGRYV